MLLWVKTLKRRIETSGYGSRPITGVDLQPVKYGNIAGTVGKSLIEGPMGLTHLSMKSRQKSQQKASQYCL